jgi:hypothetical protein
MLKLFFPLLLLVGLLASGCSRKASGPTGPEASLPELTRALQTWVMAHGSCPTDINQLTNFPTLQGKRLPTPPPGKKLLIVPATRQIVFADQ